MRMYVIGVMVGVIGLVAANQVRADGRCVAAFACVASIHYADGSGVIIN